MKNLKTALLCAAAVTIMSAPAKAEDNFYFKPYVGAEYQHTVVDYASVDGISFDDVYEDNFNGGGIYLGARIHDHLGVEVGYNRTTSEDVDNVLGTGVNTSLKLQSFTFDLMGYYPVDEAQKLKPKLMLQPSALQALVTIPRKPNFVLALAPSTNLHKTGICAEC